MNISKLLLDEMQRVSRQLVSEKYNDPQAKDITLSLNEVLRISNCKKSRPKMFGETEMIFDSYEGTYSERLEAQTFYLRVATLMEYNDLSVNIDNSLAYIMECWNKSKEDNKKGKLPPKYRNLWKYYIPLSKNIQSLTELNRASLCHAEAQMPHTIERLRKAKEAVKREKQDCLRYAFLRTIDENDQISAFGIIWRPDASISKSYDNRLNHMTREERSAEKVRLEQQERVNSPSWEVENGKVRSAYVLAFSGEEN